MLKSRSERIIQVVREKKLFNLLVNGPKNLFLRCYNYSTKQPCKTNHISYVLVWLVAYFSGLEHQATWMNPGSISKSHLNIFQVKRYHFDPWISMTRIIFRHRSVEKN